MQDHAASSSQEDALQERVDELTARYASLLSIAEELAEALRRMRSTAHESGPAMHDPDAVQEADAALARYSNLHKGEHDGS